MMSSGVNVVVKWSGNKYPVTVESGQTGLVFKTLLFSLTGVEPDRQKIMVKGGMLKDDADMGNLVKDGQVIMMMGTIGELPKAPIKPVLFEEDMSSAQMAKALNVPAGLGNLGNTCYMNATVQCLSAIPELYSAIESVKGSDPLSKLATGLGALVRDVAKTGLSFPPLVFLQLLRNVFPQFAERDQAGYMQQDAEECWSQIVSGISEKVPGLNVDGSVDSHARFVEQFMTCTTAVVTLSAEAVDEKPVTSMETFNKLRVTIGSGVSTYLVSDIASNLIEKIEKTSSSLGRSAVYSKTSKFSRLPKYLTVNFVRFQWKPQEQVKAKILKRVQFPHYLDMSTFCTLELQASFKAAKDRFKIVDEKAAEERKTRKTNSGASIPVEPVKKSITSAEQTSLAKEIGVPESLWADIGANPSGLYELVAVLTHVGRGANSGHYIGWKKQEDGSGWWKFDDDKVSLVSADDISKLEGGGDWHTAYLVLYRARPLE